MTSEQPEQGRWHKAATADMMGRTFYCRCTDSEHHLRDFLTVESLNALEAERDGLAQKLAAAGQALSDIERILNRRRAAYAQYAHGIAVSMHDALTPSEKGDSNGSHRIPD